MGYLSLMKLIWMPSTDYDIMPARMPSNSPIVFLLLEGEMDAESLFPQEQEIYDKDLSQFNDHEQVAFVACLIKKC